MQENKPPLNLNKLASLEVTLVRNYNPLSYSLKGVRSRATNVAKNSLKLSEYGKGTFFTLLTSLSPYLTSKGLLEGTFPYVSTIRRFPANHPFGGRRVCITTCILAEGPYVFWPKAPDLT